MGFWKDYDMIIFSGILIVIIALILPSIAVGKTCYDVIMSKTSIC